MISNTIYNAKQGKEIKILMFQIFSIALSQVKVDNTSENVLNVICQVIYFLYRAKEITKKYI